MVNCHIDALLGSYINVVVKPESENLINIVQEDPTKAFSCKTKKMAYKIK